MAQRGFRRPDDHVNSEKDSQILLGLYNAMFGQSSGQLSDWIFVDECVFSCKTYKQMAWAETGHNVRLSGHLSAQPFVAVATGIHAQRNDLLSLKTPILTRARPALF